eukprot:3346470-Prymnesium_polylepis.1
MALGRGRRWKAHSGSRHTRHAHSRLLLRTSFSTRRVGCPAAQGRAQAVAVRRLPRSQRLPPCVEHEVLTQVDRQVGAKVVGGIVAEGLADPGQNLRSTWRRGPGRGVGCDPGWSGTSCNVNTTQQS